MKPKKAAYSLRLTRNEICTLATVLRCVGGCPHNSPRVYATSMLDKIEKLAGRVNATDSDLGSSHEGSVYFRDHASGSRVRR